MRVAALIPAAGRGIRLGKGPKAFLELGGTTLLERVVNAFLDVDEIIVAVSQETLLEANKLLKDKAKVIVGGDTRQVSVFKLLRASHADIVLIHDVARPFLASSIIQAIIKAVKENDAATVAKNVSDTLIETVTGKVVDRSQLKAIQTPQGFERKLILRAHLNALEKNLKVTDDAGLMWHLEHRIAFIEGSNWLMKITTPIDLAIANTLVANWDNYEDSKVKVNLVGAKPCAL